MNFLFEDYYKTLSSTQTMEHIPGLVKPQTSNIHCLSLPQSNFKILQPGYQLNSTVRYMTLDQSFPQAISSATLSTRTNTILNQISQLHVIEESLASRTHIAIEPELEDAPARKREVHRYFSGTLEAPEKPTVMCEFCLAPDHTSFECPVPSSLQVWDVADDRIKRSFNNALKKVICAKCLLPGHISCYISEGTDTLFSPQTQIRKELARHNVAMGDFFDCPPEASQKSSDSGSSKEGIIRHSSTN